MRKQHTWWFGSVSGFAAGPIPRGILHFASVEEPRLERASAHFSAAVKALQSEQSQAAAPVQFTTSTNGIRAAEHEVVWS
jgi:hypothetical protein